MSMMAALPFQARSALRGGLFACLAALGLALSASCAPQTAAPARVDPELAALFDTLATTQDPLAAAAVEQQIWSRWAASGSPTVDVLLERSAAAEAAGDRALARAFLIEAAALAPDFAEPWSRRAALAYDESDFAGAISAIEETLRREPRHFGALAGLGVIYEELGEERAALRAYQEALAIHPHLEAARQGVARLSAQLDGRDA